MNLSEQNDLDKLTGQLKGVGLGLSLSKFVTLNYPILLEIRNLYIPLKTQAEIVQQSIGKPVSMASLSVAMSRLKPEGLDEEPKVNKVIVMRTANMERFVSKNANLTLGGQKEIIKINKNGIIKEEEVLIDWRGLAPGENITSWVKEYQNKLVAINSTGWRWKQIADAINKHLNLKKKISVNTLTSILSLSNKKQRKN
jgi:hypothetical protein